MDRRRTRLVRLPTDAVLSAQERPRRREDGEGPICVRRTPRGYELTAGANALCSAREAGLGEVSCLLLAEEPQRGDYLTQAQELRRLTETDGCSQTEAARRMGLSQSAAANKLRLLRQPPEILAALRETGLSERHARALLRVRDPAERLALLYRAAAEGWRVAQLEQTVARRPAPSDGGWQEVRELLRTAETLHRRVCCRREETDTETVFTIRVAKPPAEPVP